MNSNNGSRSLERRKALRATQTWIVDTLFPAKCLHLLGGLSGTGKTTWLLEQLYKWDHGEPVMGRYQSNPCPWIYVVIDRGLEEDDRTLLRLGLDEWAAPIYGVTDILEEYGNGGDIEQFDWITWMEQHPAELFVISGFQALLPSASRAQNKAELQWCVNLRSRVLTQGKTVIGITHSPKGTVTDQISQVRNGFLGTASLMGNVSTCILFEKVSSSTTPADKNEVHESQRRRVWLSGNGFPDYTVEYELDEKGRFVEMAEHVHELNLEALLRSWNHVEPITTDILVQWAQRCDCSIRTVYRFINAMVRIGAVEKYSKGFRKLLPS